MTMASSYKGIATNIVQGKGTDPDIIDDGDKLSSVNLGVGSRGNADFAEYLYEGFIAKHVLDVTTNVAINSMIHCYDICFAGSLGLWVAVGDGGKISTSPDAVTWTARTTGSSADFLCIAWNGSLFVAGQDDVGANVYTSPDGVTWTQRVVSGSGTQMVVDVVWDSASSHWIIAVTNATPTNGGFIAWSTNGIAWNLVTPSGCLDAYGIDSNGSGTVLLVGEDGGTHNAWTSTDGGATWTHQLVPGVSTVLRKVAYSAQEACFMVVDDAATPKTATSTSSAGTSWNSAKTSFTTTASFRNLSSQLKWAGRAFILAVNPWAIQWFIPQADTWRGNVPALMVNSGFTPDCVGVVEGSWKMIYASGNNSNPVRAFETLAWQFL